MLLNVSNVCAFVLSSFCMLYYIASSLDICSDNKHSTELGNICHATQIFVHTVFNVSVVCHYLVFQNFPPL